MNKFTGGSGWQAITVYGWLLADIIVIMLLSSRLTTCKPILFNISIFDAQPDLWFQSIGKGATLDLSARLWSMDGSARVIWPKNLRSVGICLKARKK